jgi:hypothetical protein
MNLIVTAYISVRNRPHNLKTTMVSLYYIIIEALQYVKLKFSYDTPSNHMKMVEDLLISDLDNYPKQMLQLRQVLDESELIPIERLTQQLNHFGSVQRNTHKLGFRAHKSYPTSDVSPFCNFNVNKRLEMEITIK